MKEETKAGNYQKKKTEEKDDRIKKRRMSFQCRMYMWAIEMQLSELANNLGENEVTKFGIKHILDNGIWDSLMIQNWSLDSEGISINTEKGEETKKNT